MITTEISCPKCDHTEPVEIEMDVRSTDHHTVEIVPRYDRDGVIERFAAHYREAGHL